MKLLPPQVFPAAVFACALLSLGAPKVHAQAPVPFSASPVPENAVNSSSSLLPLDALAAGGLPSASAPAPGSFGEKPVEPYATKLYQAPFSRIGIGADVSPLGIGIKSAVVLNTFMDARLMGNFFQYNTGRFEVDGVNVYANVHLASVEALVDAYPWASVWRVSAGVMLMNGNQLSGTTRIASGTSFNLDGLTFYSANPNAATGATPVTGSGLLGFHANQPAAIVSGGFGKFIPRSERHWSFPSEFGVIFTGAPTINVALNGWVCKDKTQTDCSNLSDPANPVTIQFNNALQAQLGKWRRTLNDFPIYPIFSYGVVYSFNIR